MQKINYLKIFIKQKKNIKNISDYIAVLSLKGYIKEGKYLKETEVIWGDTNKEINNEVF